MGGFTRGGKARLPKKPNGCGGKAWLADRAKFATSAKGLALGWQAPHKWQLPCWQAAPARSASTAEASQHPSAGNDLMDMDMGLAVPGSVGLSKLAKLPISPILGSALAWCRACLP